MPSHIVSKLDVSDSKYIHDSLGFTCAKLGPKIIGRLQLACQQDCRFLKYLTRALVVKPPAFSLYGHTVAGSHESDASFL